MTILGRDKLKKFTQKYKNATSWIENWIADVEAAKWQGPQDVKKRYSSVSFLTNNIIYFNVKGNTYRLEIQVAYKTGIVVVKWIGTHAEYDKRSGRRK